MKRDVRKQVYDTLDHADCSTEDFRTRVGSGRFLREAIISHIAYLFKVNRERAELYLDTWMMTSWAAEEKETSRERKPWTVIKALRPDEKTCMCGSGLPRRELLDSAGSFLRFVCDMCEADAREKYRSEVFE